MKTVRVSKSIMDSLNKYGYAYGSKYYYEEKELMSNSIIVERYPRYYIEHGCGEGRRLTTRKIAEWNGWIETVEVKGNW